MTVAILSHEQALAQLEAYAEHRRHQQRYVQSARQTLEVDCRDHAKQWRKELARGPAGIAV